MRTYRWFATLAVAMLAGCGDYSAPDEVLFGEAVYTQQSPAYDFKPLNTYYLDPTMKVVEDSQASNETLPSSVVAAIDANMQRLGYTAAPLASANVRLDTSLLKGTGAVYYPGYWCDYWYYYSCYYDWYYAGSYKYGTLILQMGDLSTPANQPLQIRWVAGMYGVGETGAVNVQRGVDAINRAFAQSPYLDTH